MIFFCKIVKHLAPKYLQSYSLTHALNQFSTRAAKKNLLTSLPYMWNNSLPHLEITAPLWITFNPLWNKFCPTLKKLFAHFEVNFFLPETVKKIKNFYLLLFTCYLVILFLLREENENFKKDGHVFTFIFHFSEKFGQFSDNCLPVLPHSLIRGAFLI